MQRIQSLELKGFKSIEHAKLTLGNLNLLIGPNGAGKSNFISFFKLMNRMTHSTLGNLQFFIGRSGGGSQFLFDGPAKTTQLSADLTFETAVGSIDYHVRLSQASQDTLIFADEKFRDAANPSARNDHWTHLGTGHRESALMDAATDNESAATLLGTMKRFAVFQFHNTSETARIKQRWDLLDCHHLKEDGGNLAPFLMRLSQNESHYYKRIVSTIRQINPFFEDFDFKVDSGRVILQWRELNSDVVVGTHQASDGSLRAMALITLLLQPPKNLPTVLILDEPELGLHPFAVHIIAELIQAASYYTQVIVATQSMNLLDYFSPEDVIVVDRPKRASQFHRLNAGELEEWLEDYSLSELWEKNVLGGVP